MQRIERLVQSSVAPSSGCIARYEMTGAIECRLTFCRITAASRLFAKSNYFPLYRIKTPADAALELAQKSGGVFKPKNHYIPVLLCSSLHRDPRRKKKKDKVHKKIDGFRYVNLRFDNKKHDNLISTLKKRVCRLNGNYAYRIEVRDTVVVLDAQLEQAARYGDISDITIADHSDRAIVRLRTGDRFPVDCCDVDDKNVEIFEGQAATTAEFEKQHHHYGRATMAIAHIFELKEKAAAIRELERLQLEARRRKQRERQWKEDMSKLVDNLHTTKKRHHKSEPRPTEYEMKINSNDLIKTLDASDRLSTNEHIERLPLLAELNTLVTHHLMYGQYTEIAETTGILIQHDGQHKFIVGQTVETSHGKIFVPGQTFRNENEMLYIPGITVNLDDAPAFVAGAIFANDDGSAVFLPGQTFITPDGKMHMPDNGKTNIIQPNGMTCNHVTDEKKHHRHKRKQPKKDPAKKKKYIEEMEQYDGDCEMHTETKKINPISNNGTSENGINEKINGISENGISKNGKSENGISENGISENGISEKINGIPEDIKGIPENINGMPEDINGIPEDINGKTPENIKESVEENACELNNPEVVEKMEEMKSDMNNISENVDSTLMGTTMPRRIIDEETDMSVEEMTADAAMTLARAKSRLENERDRSARAAHEMNEVIESMEIKKNKLLEKLRNVHNEIIQPENDDGVSYIFPAKANALALELGFEGKNARDVAKLLLSLARWANGYTIRYHVHGENVVSHSKDEEEDINGALKNAMAAAVEIYSERPRDLEAGMRAAGREFTRYIAMSHDPHRIIQEMSILVKECGTTGSALSDVLRDLTKKVDINKAETLRSIIREKYHVRGVISKVKLAIEEEGDILVRAFTNLAQGPNEIFVQDVYGRITETAGEMESEKDAARVAHRAIVDAVRATYDRELKEFLLHSSAHEIGHLLLESRILAQLTGMHNEARTLERLLSEDLGDDCVGVNCLAADQVTLGVIRRALVVRRLAERSPYLGIGLAALRKYGREAASSDDGAARELVLESGALVSHACPVLSSMDIPSFLFELGDTMAMEDYLVRRIKSGGALLISRGSYSAVVPREASRFVLAGLVPYTLIDDKGVTYFRPMHVFNALKMDKDIEKKYHQYSCVGAFDKYACSTPYRRTILDLHDVKHPGDTACGDQVCNIGGRGEWSSNGDEKMNAGPDMGGPRA